MNDQPFRRPDSKFLVQGVIVRDAFSAATFAYVTVRDGDRLYFDVACFEDGPLAEVRALKSGTEVRISGYIGKRKMKNVVDDQGRPRYEVQFVAQKVEQRQPAQQQPPQPQAAPQYASPQQLAYQQLPQQQAAPHAAAWDNNDNVPF